MARRKFTKTYSNPSCLVALLKSRGLEVCDEKVAMQYRRIYFDICIITYFLDVISPNNDMLSKLRWLFFVDFPEVDLKALGFPDGWEMEPLWR